MASPIDYVTGQGTFTADRQRFSLPPDMPDALLPAAVTSYLFARKVQRFSDGYRVSLSRLGGWFGWTRDTIHDYMNGKRFWHIAKIVQAADYLDEYQNANAPVVPYMYRTRQDFWQMGLPRVWLTSLTPGIAGREGCPDAQEVHSRVQAGCRAGGPSR